MGIFAQLFGNGVKAESGPMTDSEAMRIINAYGGAMVDRTCNYFELSSLPYPKTRIKEAIIHSLKEGGDPKNRELLKIGYLALAEWQVGFGSRIRPGELTAEEIADPTKAMARIASSNSDWTNVPEQVATESAMLSAELKALSL
jgi:hypothetical protein